jgi:2,3,4,5-tetrahydropyridine-2-carboxylate N-succinyltransferase
MSQQLQTLIDNAWEERTNFSPKSAPTDVRQAVADVLEQLNAGTLRVAQKDSGQWVVNQWVKKAVLLSFRLEDNVAMNKPWQDMGAPLYRRWRIYEKQL